MKERKGRTWQNITDAVNPIASIARTSTEIKLKYKDMRVQCKAKYAKYLPHLKGTGKSPSSREPPHSCRAVLGAVLFL